MPVKLFTNRAGGGTFERAEESRRRPRPACALVVRQRIYRNVASSENPNLGGPPGSSEPANFLVGAAEVVEVRFCVARRVVVAVPRSYVPTTFPMDSLWV